MLFFKKWLKNDPQFLLHFLIHIDVLMLCRKFESIPTSIFRVMTILNKSKCQSTATCTVYRKIPTYIQCP